MVLDLEILLWPEIEDIKAPIYSINYALLSFYLPENQTRKPWAEKKANLYFYWISLPSNGPSIGEGTTVNLFELVRTLSTPPDRNPSWPVPSSA